MGINISRWFFLFSYGSRGPFFPGQGELWAGGLDRKSRVRPGCWGADNGPVICPRGDKSPARELGGRLRHSQKAWKTLLGAASGLGGDLLPPGRGRRRQGRKPRPGVSVLEDVEGASGMGSAPAAAPGAALDLVPGGLLPPKRREGRRRDLWFPYFRAKPLPCPCFRGRDASEPGARHTRRRPCLGFPSRASHGIVFTSSFGVFSGRPVPGKAAATALGAGPRPRSQRCHRGRP